MELTELEYPILFVTSKGFLEAWQDANSAQRCTWLAYRRRYFDGLRVIDASGEMYRATDAKMEDRTGPVWYLLRPVINPFVQVSLELEPCGRLSLSELKQFVSEKVESLKGPWRAIGLDPAMIKSRIRAANSIAEVIQIVRGT
jgi:hypothetical protein